MSLNLITDPWLPAIHHGQQVALRPDQIAEEGIVRPDWPRADLNPGSVSPGSSQGSGLKQPHTKTSNPHKSPKQTPFTQYHHAPKGTPQPCPCAVAGASRLRT